MKRFIIAINDATKEDRDKIAEHVKERDYGYWHWFKDFWLLTTRNHTNTAASIRDELQNVVSGIHCIVLEHDGSTENWAIYGKEESFEWLHETWSEK